LLAAMRKMLSDCITHARRAGPNGVPGNAFNRGTPPVQRTC
jgi:hypothetical protein